MMRGCIALRGGITPQFRVSQKKNPKPVQNQDERAFGAFKVQLKSGRVCAPVTTRAAWGFALNAQEQAT
jgi:hypothetical protein